MCLGKIQGSSPATTDREPPSNAFQASIASAQAPHSRLSPKVKMVRCAAGFCHCRRRRVGNDVACRIGLWHKWKQMVPLEVLSKSCLIQHIADHRGDSDGSSPCLLKLLQLNLRFAQARQARSKSTPDNSL